MSIARAVELSNGEVLAVREPWDVRLETSWTLTNGYLLEDLKLT